MTDALPASSRAPIRKAGRRLPRKKSVVAAAVIAWLGLLVHNVADLPDQTLLSPGTFWPSLVTAALLAAYWRCPARAAALGLLGWALLNLVGGALSVMPLPALPFDPQQTLPHYSFHLLYAATQVPLLAVSHRLAVSPRSAPSHEEASHVVG
jgi:hypothetical protein